MKLTLARTDLARALGQIARVVERRNTIPILSNVRLRHSPGEGLLLTATDLDIEITTLVPAVIHDAIDITMPAAILDGYVRKLPDGAEILIEADGKGQGILRAGRSRVTLGTLDARDFPDMSVGDLTHSFTLPGKDLVRLFDSVAFAISTEETRYYLNGIYLHAIDDGGPKLRAVATDGHRLGRADLDGPDGSADMPGVIVPRKTVVEMTKLAAAADKADVTLSLSSSKIRLAANGATLMSKVIDGTFPDYARVIPQGNGKLAQVKVKDLASAIDRVATVSLERGRAVKFDLRAGEPIRLRVHSPDQGEATDEVDVTYDDVPIEIGFNARYVGDVLATLGSEAVEIALGDPGSPTIWRDPNDAARLYVLMPMRV